MQALAADRSEDSEVEAELQVLLANLPEARASSSRWLNWDVLSSIELNALDAWSRNVSDRRGTVGCSSDLQATMDRSLRRIVSEPHEDLMDLTDLACLSNGGAWKASQIQELC